MLYDDARLAVSLVLQSFTQVWEIARARVNLPPPARFTSVKREAEIIIRSIYVRGGCRVKKRGGGGGGKVLGDTLSFRAFNGTRGERKFICRELSVVIQGVDDRRGSLCKNCDRFAMVRCLKIETFDRRLQPVSMIYVCVCAFR